MSEGQGSGQSDGACEGKGRGVRTKPKRSLPSLVKDTMLALPPSIEAPVESARTFHGPAIPVVES